MDDQLKARQRKLSMDKIIRSRTGLGWPDSWCDGKPNSDCPRLSEISTRSEDRTPLRNSVSR